MKFAPGSEEPTFEFIGSVLLSIIAHDCNCVACSLNRQNAAASLMWLIGLNSNVNVRYDQEAGEMRMDARKSFEAMSPPHGVDTPASLRSMLNKLEQITKPETQEGENVLRALVEKRLADPGISIDERAQLQGWLARIFKD